jgi:hypothetical protein
VASHVFEATSPLPGTASAAYAWHLRPGALLRLLPPWQDVRVVYADSPLREGARVVLRIGVGPVSVDWTAVHRDFVAGRSFVDEQAGGPFAAWRHEHRVDATPDGQARLTDRVEWSLPGGALGDALGAARMEHDLRVMFAWRHWRTSRDLARHAAFDHVGPKRVLVSGASGTVGSAVCALLGGGGHTVLRLVRGAVRDAATERAWRPDAGQLDPAALDGVDVVLHLAGENVAGGRWTPARKAAIMSSRVEGTRLLAEAIARHPGPKPAFVCASATGLYGDRGDARLDESATGGAGFLADVVRAWESAAEPARAAGARTVHLRFGVLLDPRSGALEKMLPAFRAGLGGRVGSGRQWMPWIDLDDAVGALHRAALDATFDGDYNVVSPEGATQGELATTLARVLGRPVGPPLPEFAVSALFGEMGREALLASTHAVPTRLQAAGFEFGAPSLEAALRLMLGKQVKTHG